MVNLIIPVYKSLDTLPKALNSLLAQTKQMFLVTLVQDCDGEDYSSIVKKYKELGLKCTLVKTPHNGGPGYARQYGVDLNKMCDYIMFMDADDMLMPRAIEVLYSEAKRNNADIIYSDFMLEKNHQPPVLMAARDTSCTWLHGKIYRAEYLKRNNIRFLDDLRFNEDAYFNVVAFNCTKNKYAVEEVTYLWRDNPKSVTRDKNSPEGDFFRKAWFLFVKSQVYGILKIIELTGGISPGLLAYTFKNVYDQMMVAMFRGEDLSVAKESLAVLKDSEEVQKNFDDPVFWKTISSCLMASIITDENELIFYKMRFPEWLNEYVVKEKKDVRDIYS